MTIHFFSNTLLALLILMLSIENSKAHQANHVLRQADKDNIDAKKSLGGEDFAIATRSYHQVGDTGGRCGRRESDDDDDDDSSSVRGYDKINHYDFHGGDVEGCDMTCQANNDPNNSGLQGFQFSPSIMKCDCLFDKGTAVCPDSTITSHRCYTSETSATGPINSVSPDEDGGYFCFKYDPLPQTTEGNNINGDTHFRTAWKIER